MDDEQPSTSGISDAERMRAVRAKETPAQRELRLANDRERKAKSRTTEDPVTKKLRLDKMRKNAEESMNPQTVELKFNDNDASAYQDLYIVTKALNDEERVSMDILSMEMIGE